MDSFEKISIEEILRSELGKAVNFTEYNPGVENPMTFVLDEVKRQMGDIFSVFWVDGGHPEVFCLDNFSKTAVIFNTRYLSLSVFARQLFIDSPFSNLTVQFTERAALQLIAEMALRKGNTDFAVLAFVKSIMASGLTSVWGDDDRLNIMAMEQEVIDESYMAVWFYGLLHELGHLKKNESRDFSDGDMFSDKKIFSAIQIGIEKMNLPKEIKQKALDLAKNKDSNSIIEINHVRSEGLADIFACSVLLRTTYNIMKEIAQKDFETIRFIQETIIFHNIIGFIDRCRRVAHIASETNTDYETALNLVLHPISIIARTLIQRQYLDLAIANFLFGNEPTQKQFEQVQKVINEISLGFKKVVDDIDTGISNAMEFCLYVDQRENEWELLESFRLDFLKAGITTYHIQKFCDIADSLGKDSKLLRALKNISTDPTKKVQPDPSGDSIYFVPWVEGPDHFDQPFGLDTKHGHLVFVFHSQGDLYEAFFNPSVEMLAPGYKLKRAMIPVPREERLGPELAVRMPKGKAFQIIIEGTEEFSQYIQELFDDSIWV